MLEETVMEAGTCSALSQLGCFLAVRAGRSRGLDRTGRRGWTALDLSRLARGVEWSRERSGVDSYQIGSTRLDPTLLYCTLRYGTTLHYTIVLHLHKSK